VKQPVPPPGEDAVSFERHTKALQAEFKKTNRNNALVSDLMERSFALRRADILENNYSLAALLSRFPFLQEADQLMTEMQRLVGDSDLRDTAVSSWKSLLPDVFKQI
jgi:hypothetical protein